MADGRSPRRRHPPGGGPHPAGGPRRGPPGRAARRLSGAHSRRALARDAAESDPLPPRGLSAGQRQARGRVVGRRRPVDAAHAVRGVSAVTLLATYVVLGIAVGSIYGIAAVGLVLTYRTSGVFNFAHGTVAAVGAYTFYV